MGADNPTYRLNADKVCQWLLAKLLRLARHLQSHGPAPGDQQAAGHAAGFTLTGTAQATPPEGPSPAKTSASSPSLPARQFLEEALDLLSEYVGEELLGAVRRRSGLGGQPATPKPASAPALSKAAAWAAAGAGSGIIDPSKYRGVAAPSAAGEDRGTKRKASGPVSVAAKRLAKTDTRGMKSMTSFFAKKPRK